MVNTIAIATVNFEKRVGTYSHIVRNYSSGKLDGKFRTELISDGEVIYLIEGEYSQGEKTGQWKETNFETY